ncbi:MAG TPA: Gfo/Idh/MocA family oxidoreductase [Candidatus Binataceae bacterium]|nr:Gfo/Idh/MocA family oxidoreductase [Candidatus Binataceae bacterium]
MSLLRGVISGFGEVAAQAHFPGWHARNDVSLRAIHDPVAARRHVAINLGLNLRVYDDLALMLDGESPDFVDITSPPAFHADAARLALNAGAHVLVEKPLCLNLIEFQQLAALARARSCVLMCAHNWQFAPAYKRAHELISSGRIGDPRYVSLIRLRGHPAGAIPTNPHAGDSSKGTGLSTSGERWRLDANTGGGILLDHGWHTFYLLHRLLGLGAPPDPNAASRGPMTLSAHLSYPRGSTVDDLADLRLMTTHGPLANIHVSWRSPVRRTSATLFGDQGLLEIEGDRVILATRDGSMEDHSVEDAPDDSYHRPWFADLTSLFVDAIAEGPDGPLVRRNHAEVHFALAATAAARASNDDKSAAKSLL